MKPCQPGKDNTYIISQYNDIQNLSPYLVSYITIWYFIDILPNTTLSHEATQCCVLLLSGSGSAVSYSRSDSSSPPLWDSVFPPHALPALPSLRLPQDHRRSETSCRLALCYVIYRGHVTERFCCQCLCLCSCPQSETSCHSDFRAAGLSGRTQHCSHAAGGQRRACTDSERHSGEAGGDSPVRAPHRQTSLPVRSFLLIILSQNSVDVCTFGFFLFCLVLLMFTCIYSFCTETQINSMGLSYWALCCCHRIMIIADTYTMHTRQLQIQKATWKDSFFTCQLFTYQKKKSYFNINFLPSEVCKQRMFDEICWRSSS